MIILTQPILVRRLISLGWDTLEIYDSKNRKGVKWGLLKFSDTIGFLN